MDGIDHTPDIQTGPLLTRDEVAEKLHLKPDTASKIMTATGMAINIARRVYIYERDLDQYLSSLRGR